MHSSCVTRTSPPALDGDGLLVLRLAGHEHASEVRLLQEVRRPRDEPRLQRVRGGWWTRFDPGPVDRLEYRFAVRHRDGSQHVTTDPHNPTIVGNPFGDRSVWTRPGYEHPRWLRVASTRHGVRRGVSVHSATLLADLPVRVWSHPDLAEDAVAPLLVVHDGPAMDDEAAFGRFLDHLADDRRLPPLRAAMIGVDDRDRLFSADPAYARALARDVLPALAGADGLAPADAVVGVGASLGALAHLHAAVRHPGTYDALFLQSGSFFRPLVDDVESGFPWFDRVTGFTDRLLADGPGGEPLPVTVTCGLVEENLANNRVVAGVLARAGWPVRLVEHRDAHTMTSWRDVLDPHLRDLLVRSVGTA